MFAHTFRLLFLRTRLLAVAGAVLVAANLLLPLLLSATPAPDADPLQLYLTYSSALDTFLLTLFALWASCAALPQEAELHTLPLLLTRPISRLRIWLGKWLAVLAALAILLALAAASATAAGASVHRRSQTPSPLLPYAYESVAPVLPDTSATEALLLARHRAHNKLLPDAPLPPRIVQNAHDVALADAFTLPVGDAPLLVDFPPLPDPLPSATDLLLVYRCDPALPGAYPFHASFLLERPSLPATALDVHAPSGRPDLLRFPLDPDPAPPLPDAAPEKPRLRIRQIPADNADADPDPVAFCFDPADGLSLRIPVSTFAANLAKYLLALFARLALLAAIGTSLGTLFSLPVAAFLSVALVVLLQCSATLSDGAHADRETFLHALSVVTDHAPADPDGHDHSAHASAHSLPRPVALAIYYAYRATYALLAPLIADDAPDRFLAADRIPAAPLARAAAVDLLLAPGLLALLSAAALRRREWMPPR